MTSNSSNSRDVLALALQGQVFTQDDVHGLFVCLRGLPEEIRFDEALSLLKKHETLLPLVRAASLWDIDPDLQHLFSRALAVHALKKAEEAGSEAGTAVAVAEDAKNVAKDAVDIASCTSANQAAQLERIKKLESRQYGCDVTAVGLARLKHFETCCLSTGVDVEEFLNVDENFVPSFPQPNFIATGLVFVNFNLLVGFGNEASVYHGSFNEIICVYKASILSNDVNFQRSRLNECAVIGVLSGTNIGPELFATIISNGGAPGIPGVEAPHIAIAMSYTGESFSKDTIGKSTRYTLSLLAQAAHKLRKLHKIGIAHLDIKPENLTQLKGKVRVVDFGFAQRIGDDTSNAPGTVGYRAPELESGEKTAVTEAMDMFSLGCTTQTLIKRSDMNRELEQLVDGCLKTVPSERITASEFCARATKILDSKKPMIPQNAANKDKEKKSNPAELAFKTGTFNVQKTSQPNRSGFGPANGKC